MSTTIKIPKFCEYCGQAFIAQKTTTRFCSHPCASRAYKQRKREEKVRKTLKKQINSVSAEESKKLQALQNLPVKTGNYENLREKEFLSITEAAALIGASRWTIQRMIKRNQLSVAKFGRRTIIKRDSIDNLFNQGYHDSNIKTKEKRKED